MNVLTKPYIAFDIGGTNVKWGLLSKEGELLQHDLFSSKDGDSETILAGMRKILREVDVAGIAVSMPGFIHADTGYIEFGGAIVGFHHFPLKDTLEAEFGIPVTVENDVNCVALAEKWKGNAQDLTDFVCITVGTGIGGAMYLNNDLYRGHAYRGGEVGFIITADRPGTRPLDNCLSMIGSMRGLLLNYAKLRGTTLENVTGEACFADYDNGDPEVIALVDDFYSNLTKGLFNIGAILNPQKILLGGGITSRGAFLGEMRKHLADMNDMKLDIPLELCSFGNTAGMIGALHYHLQQVPVAPEKKLSL
ncbi:ROK family protein [Paenalkalicoccus suaedae]|uniref:ROK family protein n=1 Tax=Paenalkalicoccus suaedae TaxID=2592382 RepID=A0A859FJ08_9BACI|nr:ROK family protein [Paenalkalicoccus suaedae]QKS72376.1 ROK family protein [Paenalkalicoccus suaedae]